MSQHDNAAERSIPVQVIDTGSRTDDGRRPRPGIALCLSGGGYRGMLFHVGALLRLNELGYLSKLTRISSVSGGAIAAGVLGVKWSTLGFRADGVGVNFGEEVIQPLRALAGLTIDESSIAGGIFTPASIADKVADAFRDHLFGNATLQDLPPDPPRFVINATSVQTGALFRFSRPFMADYRVGFVPKPTIEIAVAVAASSAFPPVLSPLTMEVDRASWAPPSGRPSEDLHVEPYLSKVVLSDGGVYDNLGLETAWKNYQTILVSDGGGRLAPEPDPKGDWARHAIRVTEIVENQVRSLRKRQVIGSFEAGERRGTYWGIRSHIGDYYAENALPCPPEKTIVLANLKTRFKRLEPIIQERIINWGYAICDAAMRRWVEPAAPAPADFPYGEAGIG